MRFFRRLDELDRLLLGLDRQAADKESEHRWGLAFLVAALAYIVAGLTLLFIGRSEWIIALNLAAMCGFLVGA